MFWILRSQKRKGERGGGRGTDGKETTGRRKQGVAWSWWERGGETCDAMNKGKKISRSNWQRELGGQG